MNVIGWNMGNRLGIDWALCPFVTEPVGFV